MRQIDADSLIERLNPYKNKYGGESFPYDIVHDAFIYEIEQAPTIEAEPVRHGKWIEYPIADGMNQCSECGVLRFGDSNYCPNCGARMDAK